MASDIAVSAPVRGAAHPLVLYSTNTYLKYRMQETHVGHHHVWCSPVFEGAKLGRYAPGAGQPPSSDPASIYSALVHAVRTSDQHDAKIVSQKAVLPAVAVQLCAGGKISEAARNEIVTVVAHSNLFEWRPLIFVIPYAPIADRVVEVERARRASSEPEYIIEDLRSHEFDIIEPAIT